MDTKTDETDERILACLSRDAKMRIHLLARKVGIPASTAHHRIKRMEREGIISSYTINKNFKLLGFGILAHVLVFVDVSELKRMKRTQQDIATALSRIEGAERAEIITGEADLLLTVRCRDMDDYRRVLLGKIQAIDGITETRTIMVISE
ncbi:MAG: Lrp/AsnC family transcriptional regulator [Candidatus Micrarchaeia archaeon]|jgi:DNA-binding Lrp family transcriptional regulator